MIKYSIIVPVYNNKKSLEICLLEVKKQINKNTEIIVIDDCSTDDCIRDIAEKFASKFVRLKKNSGAGRARNFGVKFAKGEWLIFIDSDVLVSGSFLTKVIEKIKKLPAGFCLQGVYSINTPVRNIYSRYKNLYYYYNFFHRITGNDFCYMSSHCFIIPKKIFKLIGGFNSKIKTVIEDADFSLRLLRKNYRVLLDRKLVVAHLKEFSLFNLLLNDARLSFAKAKHILRNIFLSDKDRLIIISGGRLDEMYTVIFNVLISPLIVLAVFFMIFWNNVIFIYIFILLCLFFLLLNYKFFIFVKNKESWNFLIRIIPLCFLDMFFAFTGVLFGTIDYIFFRRKY